MTATEGYIESSCIIQLKNCCCGARLKPFVTGPFFVRSDNGRRVNLLTTLYYCKSCDLAIRGLDFTNPLLTTHYELALYTDPEKEEYWRERRRVFFTYFQRLGLKHLGKQPECVLDFGCSYGHLLDVFADSGAKTLGVEVSPQMFEKVKREGRHQVYRTIEDPDIADNSVDLITAIDSIYCCREYDPAKIFVAFHRKLKPGGLVITRTTNRNLVFRAYALAWHLFHGKYDKPAPIPYRVCGDALLNFSKRALLRSVEKAGLKKVAAYRLEQKRKRPAEYLRDLIALGLYYVSFGQIDICPGFVFVAQKYPLG